MKVQSKSKIDKALVAVHIAHTNGLREIRLTKREAEILEYIGQGLTMKKIGVLLHISTHTIITHKKNLFDKFKVNNLVRLAVLAERYNLIKK